MTRGERWNGGHGRRGGRGIKAGVGRNVSVAVAGVPRCLGEGERHEKLRQRTHVRMQEELVQLKAEWLSA